MTIKATFEITACETTEATRHHSVNILQIDGDNALPSPIFNRHGEQENKVEGVIALVKAVESYAEARDEVFNITLFAGKGVSAADVEHLARIASDDVMVVIGNDALKRAECNVNSVVVMSK